MTKREKALVAKLRARIRELESQLDLDDSYYPPAKGRFVGELGKLVQATLEGMPPVCDLQMFPLVEKLLHGKPIVFSEGHVTFKIKGG